MAALERLGGETWFRLGDIDLATHIRRTELLAAGWPASQVTAELARRLGITDTTILPMTDQPVETAVQLAEDGQWVHFQEYFVHRRTDAAIARVRFDGIEQAAPAPGVGEALAEADLIAICPSNPFVSIAPILAVRGMRAAIADARGRGAKVAGVSPIIGGATVKGPAARMLVELGFEASALGVARQYADLLDMFVIDTVDADQAEGMRGLGIRPLVVNAWMRGRRGEARLARAMLGAVR
jgi:LPPG:FO 2-phospho-L-lactate transferase